MTGRDFKALSAYQAPLEFRPFEWWAHDCATYACRAIAAAGGPDLLAKYQPWATQEEALAIVRAAGGMEALFDALLTPVHPALAARADLAAVKDEGPFGYSLAVVEGQTLAVPGRNRVRRIPRRLADLTWTWTPVGLPDALTQAAGR